MTALHHTKNALRIVLLGCVALPFVVCSGTGAASSAQLVPGDSLTTADAAFIKEKKFLDDSEMVEFFYTPGKSAKKQGVILTNRKVLVFEAEKVQKAEYTEIYDLSTAYSDTSAKPSIITVERKDDTVFTCKITSVDQIDQKFYSRLMDLWQAGKAGPAGAKTTTAADTGGSVTFGVTMGNQQSGSMQLSGPGGAAGAGAKTTSGKLKQ